MQLRIDFKQEADGRWIAEVPALPGVMTYGADRADALAKVQTLALRVLADRLEHGDATPNLLKVSFEAAKEYRLGLLLVHGIGRQRPGEALVHWGDALLKTIGRCTDSRVVATAGPAGPGCAPDREWGAEAVVQLRAGDHQEQWLLSDGWWADAFLAPSYGELVSWSVRALPWSIALHIAHRYWHAAEEGRLAKVLPATAATVKLAAALLLAPLFIVLLILTLLLGLIPVPQLRTLILAAQGTLASSIGDSLAFVESPIRAALIRTQVLKGLARLKERCERTIVIAHSQGAAVVLDALGAIRVPGNRGDEVVQLEPSAPDVVPDTVVTFGAGTNQLASLKVLSAGLPSRIKMMNPVSYTVAALVSAAGASVWLYADLIARRTTVLQLVHMAGLLLFFCSVGGLVLWALKRLIPPFGKWWHAHTMKKDPFVPTIAVLAVLGFPVFLQVYPEADTWPVSVLFLTLGGLAGSISMILSREVRTIFTAVRNPAGLRRWIDLYASADPVPNGRTRTGETGVPESVPIWNLGSFFADHTTYWDNLDGFVLRVVRACAETAESPWTAELPSNSALMDKRAAWRVGWLRLARWAVGVSWVAVGTALWIRHGRDIPLPFELPGWLTAVAVTAMRVVVLAALVGIACWLSFAVIRLLWQHWVRVEQEAVLARQSPSGREVEGVLRIGMLVWIVFGVAISVVRHSGSDSGEFLPNPSELVLFVAFACVSTMALLKLRPAPSTANAATEVATAYPPSRSDRPDF